ncbi:MAG: PadR family transcriptional regulator [Planctomycetota bacterium]|nr:helix-turn-helix transcriptional regulator [Planctomycetaceae bacterium]MDQ3331260.1 PadR family transcriptional regulator [Planctomycetota bacterium]
MDPKLFPGAIELLVLEILSEGPSYGYEVTQTVLSRSAGRFELKEGSLYPALHKLERAKMLTAFWQEAEGRRRKYYKLTAAGRKALAARKTAWREFAAGLEGVLGASPRRAGTSHA